MSRLKVAFIPSNVSGVMYYRAWMPAEALRAYQRVDVAVLWYQTKMYLYHSWERDLIFKQFSSIERDIEMACEWADVVVWMQLVSPFSLDLYLRMKTKYKKPFIVETDDYGFSIPSTNIASTQFYPGSPIIKIFMDQIEAADAMVVSTPYLKSLYSRYHDNIYVIENALDLPSWPRLNTSHTGPGVTIGWVGGASHTEDLELVKDTIFQILEKYPHVRFTCMHGIPPFFKDKWHINCVEEFKPMNLYPAWVRKQNFDIGIAPLVDNNFNRGKSNLRWLEMSAMGIPTVCSPLPHFTGSVKHGLTGMIAESPAQWMEYLSALIESENLRRTIGHNAHEEIRVNWNPTRQGTKYLALLREVIRASSDKTSIATEGRRLNQRPEQHAVVHV